MPPLIPRKGAKPAVGRALATRERWPLAAPLLRLSPNPRDHWTIGDSFEHTLILGGTGSGKTSASGASLATAFLKAGYGGLVLCAKPDEASRWEGYARAAGRATATIRFDLSGRYRFNFLDHLMALPKHQGGGNVDNAVNALMRIVEIAHGREGSAQAENDFWNKAVRVLLTMAIGSLYHAYGRVRLDELIQLINSVPSSEEQSKDADFQSWSFCFATMQRLFHEPRVPLPRHEAGHYVSYFGQTFGKLDPKTRSNILITLNAEIDPFLRGPLRDLFCTSTNIIPEVTHQGVVLILDLPVKRLEHLGVVAQVLMKYLWQKLTERRTVDASTRPQFLFADEAQIFCAPYDLEFQSTARSARAATVYITQNLPSLYARLGGRNPHDQADAIIGNFQTKILHANTDNRTNQWAAEMIGREIKHRRSSNWSHGQNAQVNQGRNWNWGTQEGESEGETWGRSWGWSYSGNIDHGQMSFSSSVNRGGQKSESRSRSTGVGVSTGSSIGSSDSEGGGVSEQMDYRLQPSFFANGLRQGGERNNYFVSAVFLQANRIFFRTGTCWTPVVFKQR
ncbi:MAG: type IV secretion system DNA-binding domain-containing protein [Alphaproteobacteria bacterium]|nr:type IV secretion system DNA-binding domain-containing protein [Alphaproteobacteria bacterium]MBV9694246.1 type IV secretion system DNA-binding domain-containing protein [Alphaproteobacteria bacterium]